MGVGDLVSQGDLIVHTKMNSKLESVENADVTASAAIVESKLSLDYGTSALKTMIDGKVSAFTIDRKLGSDCSGTDGQTNRQLTLTSTPTQIVLVSVQGAIQYLTTDYTLATNKVTFLNSVWDDQKIEVIFY